VYTGRWESQLVHGTPPHTPIQPMRLAGFLSEAHTSGETVSVRHPLGACWCFSQCGRALRSSERTRLQDLERAQQLTRAVHAAPNAPLSADELCRGVSVRDGAGVRERDGARGRVLGSGVGRGGRVVVVLYRETSVKGLFWEPWSRGVVPCLR
jgi:hypothetical protein